MSTPEDELDDLEVDVPEPSTDDVDGRFSSDSDDDDAWSDSESGDTTG